MANYYGTTRTNYFGVTDPARLQEIMDKVVADEDAVELYTREVDGITKYGFGCYSTISGYENDDEADDPYDYDTFVEDLQKILAPDDAIVITEIGSEKLRYLCAFSLIITKEQMCSVDHLHAVGEKLCELMGDDGFQTCFDY